MMYRASVIILCVTFIARAHTQGCKTPHQEDGNCVSIKQCPYLLRIFLTKKNEPSAIELLKRSQCGFQGSDPKVCCSIVEPSDENFGSEPGLDVNTCGRTNLTKVRVVGGSPAELGAWPWMAAIGYSQGSKPGPLFRCGGTLISDKYVVTAAHCVLNIGRMKVTVVRLGDLDLDEDVVDNATPIDIPVTKVVAHPQYEVDPVQNDIALLTLEYAPKFTWLIKPICLPTSEELRSSQYSSRMPFVIGWGAMGWRKDASTRLLEAQVPTLSLEECKDLYSDQRAAVIDERVICAGRGGKDACQGDSGGPLILPQGNTYYLIGVVSFGIKCANADYPGIYTRVAYFLDWLNANMK